MPAPHTPESTRLDHVGLNVTDLASCARWYGAAFGYEVELELRVDPIDLDIVMLRHPDGTRLELLHRPGASPGPRAADPAEAALTEGFSHLAFDVRGLDGEFARLVLLGAREVMTPRPSPEEGVRMAYLADPEGNLVELVERPEPE
ncbi:VOC family protein [Demequina sp. NBRC 110054]|uniref:VOC family protein n=1 Tax=Demequina sp. NBRC 110054 TaxID=1570343 RepID=UPI000A004675|nr:VOC family protein [Demequina sp. NBRC 110054]